LAKLNSNDLVKIFRSIKGNNNCLAKANKIIDTAKNSITPKDGISGKEISLTNLILLYEALNKQHSQIESQVELFFNNFEFSLTDKKKDLKLNPIQAVLTIPGVGIKTIATIIASCGDLSIFNSSTSFIGYIGLYPQQYQSGKTNKSYSPTKKVFQLLKNSYIVLL